tara:strand:- start:1 stop:435 length:435 start_codon:yes stop_codon:yes gene_type:complete
MENKWDSRHQKDTITNWKKYGLICREGETYKGIYYHVMSVNNCELCNVEFPIKGICSAGRCMDHCHMTNYFRQVLCRKCNTGFDRELRKSKTGHRWISPAIHKYKSGNIAVAFIYQRKGFKSKSLQSITKLICLSFINIIKKPT